MIFPYISITNNILLLLFIIAILKFINKEINRHIKKDLYDRYEKVMAIYNVAKEIAYTKIFRDSILVHTSSGMRLDKHEIYMFGKEFVKLVFKICGPNIADDIIAFNGDIESASILLINYFIQRVDIDENSMINIESNKEELPSEGQGN